jgi:hypothetical protein
MLIVRIYVNSEHIGTVTARRIKGDAKPSSVNTYLINEGTKTIKHRYGDGAAKLARKMLRHIEVH